MTLVTLLVGRDGRQPCFTDSSSNRTRSLHVYYTYIYTALCNDAGGVSVSRYRDTVLFGAGRGGADKWGDNGERYVSAPLTRPG